MRCRIELSTAALLNNYRLFHNVHQSSVMVPVLKSNAYGHGLEAVYRILQSENPSWIGVNYLFEAQQLRAFGHRGRILIVGPVRHGDLAEAATSDCDILLTDQAMKAAWLVAPRKPRIHVKFDTGMSRQGFLPEEAAALAMELLPYRSLVCGIASHFANVEDVLEHGYADKQLGLFQQSVAAFRQAGHTDILAHIASSASSLIMERSHHNLARVGIALYGLWPSQATRLSYLNLHQTVLDLKPVLQWRTEVASTKSVKAGQFIGYGCTYRANHPMTIAVLPVGYYEGYPRLASNRGSYVLIKGQRCPIVGRICMNMMMVDVSHVGPLDVGETVTLIGQDGDEMLDAATVAEWAQTIHYELLSRLNPLIPREIKA